MLLYIKSCNFNDKKEQLHLIQQYGLGQFSHFFGLHLQSRPHNVCLPDQWKEPNHTAKGDHDGFHNLREGPISMYDGCVKNTCSLNVNWECLWSPYCGLGAICGLLRQQHSTTLADSSPATWRRRTTDQQQCWYLQDLFVRLSDGVLQGHVPLSSLLHLPLGLPHLFSELLQPPPGSRELSLILLHLTLLLHLISLQRQDLEKNDRKHTERRQQEYLGARSPGNTMETVKKGESVDVTVVGPINSQGQLLISWLLTQSFKFSFFLLCYLPVAISFAEILEILLLYCENGPGNAAFRLITVD